MLRSPSSSCSPSFTCCCCFSPLTWFDQFKLSLILSHTTHTSWSSWLMPLAFFAFAKGQIISCVNLRSPCSSCSHSFTCYCCLSPLAWLDLFKLPSILSHGTCTFLSSWLMPFGLFFLCLQKAMVALFEL